MVLSRRSSSALAASASDACTTALSLSFGASSPTAAQRKPRVSTLLDPPPTSAGSVGITASMILAASLGGKTASCATPPSAAANALANSGLASGLRAAAA